MNPTLVDTLAQVGKPTEVWSSPDGSTAIVLPYGGRILALFAPTSKQNFFWIHHALNSVDSARTFYRSTEWHNSGGDRTWLSPEIDLFFPQLPNLDPYLQPREFDPGNYHLVREKDTIILVNRFSLKHFGSGHAIDLEITKCVSPAYNPLRHLKPSLGSKLEYAGYTLRTRLEFIDGSPAEIVQTGLWSLLQLPHGGELLIPTLSKTAVTIYMGHIESCDLTVTPYLIRYKMHAVGEHKIGIQAPTAVGRVAYLHHGGSCSSLVIRNFIVNPSAEYIDVPWAETDCVGSAIEACNVNSNLGAFSELEYHAPAIGGLTDPSSYEDESQLWAFRGTEQEIKEVAQVLISPDA